MRSEADGLKLSFPFAIPVTSRFSMNRAMKLSMVAICLLAGSAFGATEPSGAIANVSARTNISLNGTWNIIVDPYDTGFDYRFYENRKPRGKDDLVEYDFNTSE